MAAAREQVEVQLRHLEGVPRIELLLHGRAARRLGLHAHVLDQVEAAAVAVVRALRREGGRGRAPGRGGRAVSVTAGEAEAGSEEAAFVFADRLMAFDHETDDCRYVIRWTTSYACPIGFGESGNCAVEDARTQAASGLCSYKKTTFLRTQHRWPVVSAHNTHN